MFRGIRDTYYIVDTHTKKRESLGTNNAEEAERLLGIKNEAVQHVEMNLQIAQVYLQHSDPSLVGRSWADVMQKMASMKTGPTKERYEMAIKDPAFDLMRDRKLLETKSEHFLAVLQKGTVSTNVYLRRLHNFALGMQWLPWAVLPRLQWPTVKHKEKRAVTFEEYQRIIAREKNPEMNAYLRLLWHLGGSQSDVAALTADDVDRQSQSIAFNRKKTGVPVIISFGAEAAEILRTLPKTGYLFPRLARLHEKHRAKLFAKRIATLGISGISLHSFRYSWAERAKILGMEERHAMQALGHTSKALARAYSKKARFAVPSLEELESKIVPLPMAVNQ